MHWRGSQTESRERYLAKFDVAEVDAYDSLNGQLTSEEEAAYLSDVNRVFTFVAGMSVLDVGAGTGVVCKLLSRLKGLSITALEPAPAMLAKLKGKPELQNVHPVEGFCDHPDDRLHFSAGQFDVIVSRQLGNGLFDPLAASENWHN